MSVDSEETSVVGCTAAIFEVVKKQSPFLGKSITQFFFLRYGRRRSKAWSLHECKQVRCRAQKFRNLSSSVIIGKTTGSAGLCVAERAIGLHEALSCLAELDGSGNSLQAQFMATAGCASEQVCKLLREMDYPEREFECQNL